MHFRSTLFVCMLAATLGCGGSDEPTTDSGTDALVGSDAANQTPDSGADVDAAVDEDAGEDLDASVPEDASMTPDASIDCTDAGGDAGTVSTSEFCMEVCGTYLPLCSTVPPDCQATCLTANAMRSPSELARVVVCLDIESAQECASVTDCVTTAIGCP